MPKRELARIYSLWHMIAKNVLDAHHQSMVLP
jgi:hypothetical protein